MFVFVCTALTILYGLAVASFAQMAADGAMVQVVNAHPIFDPEEFSRIFQPTLLTVTVAYVALMALALAFRRFAR